MVVNAILFLIAPLMAFLSLTLKDSINRWANIIVGIVITAFGLLTIASISSVVSPAPQKEKSVGYAGGIATLTTKKHL
jgi:hypothetical protein